MTRAIDRGARNPGTLDQLIDVGLDGITVDGQLTAGDIFDLGTRFRSFDPDSLQTYSVAGTPDTVNGAAVLHMVEGPETEATLSIFRGGVAGELAPASVRLTVHNGTGVARQGADATAALRGPGSTPPWPATSRAAADGTVVRFPPGQEAAADLVARWLVGGAVGARRGRRRHRPGDRHGLAGCTGVGGPVELHDHRGHAAAADQHDDNDLAARRRHVVERPDNDLDRPLVLRLLGDPPAHGDRRHHHDNPARTRRGAAPGGDRPGASTGCRWSRRPRSPPRASRMADPEDGLPAGAGRAAGGGGRAGDPLPPRLLGSGRGYIGVELFFVLSGWLVCALLVNEHQRTDRIALGQFWLRRLRRLLPAVVVVIAGTLAWAAFAQPDRLAELRRQASAPWATT